MENINIECMSVCVCVLHVLYIYIYIHIYNTHEYLKYCACIIENNENNSLPKLRFLKLHSQKHEFV